MLARYALIVVALVTIGWSLGVAAISIIEGHSAGRDAALAVGGVAGTVLIYLMLRRRER